MLHVCAEHEERERPLSSFLFPQAPHARSTSQLQTPHTRMSQIDGRGGQTSSILRMGCLQVGAPPLASSTDASASRASRAVQSGPGSPHRGSARMFKSCAFARVNVGIISAMVDLQRIRTPAVLQRVGFRAVGAALHAREVCVRRLAGAPQVLIRCAAVAKEVPVGS
jgi:hypothetical protein